MLERNSGTQPSIHLILLVRKPVLFSTYTQQLAQPKSIRQTIHDLAVYSQVWFEFFGIIAYLDALTEDSEQKLLGVVDKLLLSMESYLAQFSDPRTDAMTAVIDLFRYEFELIRREVQSYEQVAERITQICVLGEQIAGIIAKATDEPAIQNGARIKNKCKCD